MCRKEQELPCGIVDQEQSKDLSSNAKHSGFTFPQKHQEFNLACRKRTQAFLWHYGSRTSKDLSSNAKHSRSTFPQKPQEANCNVQVKNKESNLPFLLYLPSELCSRVISWCTIFARVDLLPLISSRGCNDAMILNSSCEP